MFELVVLMTYLARCWQLIGDLQAARTAVPVKCLDEFQGLHRDLTALFADPSHVLNPLVRRMIAGEGEEGCCREGESDGAAGQGQAAEEVNQPPPVAVTCPACEGAGEVQSRFLGIRPVTCHICGGMGNVGTL